MRGSLRVRCVDGRTLRPLVREGFAVLNETEVVPTEKGRRVVARDAASGEGRQSGARLNETQQDMLRRIIRDGRVLDDYLDGRIARALLARGVVRSEDGWILPTEVGREALASAENGDGRRRKSSSEAARASAIRRAVRQLEEALPPGAEVLVGNLMASAQDLVDGFRKHARKLERGKAGPV